LVSVLAVLFFLTVWFTFRLLLRVGLVTFTRTFAARLPRYTSVRFCGSTFLLRAFTVYVAARFTFVCRFTAVLPFVPPHHTTVYVTVGLWTRVAFPFLHVVVYYGSFRYYVYVGCGGGPLICGSTLPGFDLVYVSVTLFTAFHLFTTLRVAFVYLVLRCC